MNMSRLNNIQNHITNYRASREARRKEFGPDLLDTTIEIGKETVGATIDAGKYVAQSAMNVGRKATNTTVGAAKTATNATIGAAKTAANVTVGFGKAVVGKVADFTLDLKDKYDNFKNREREPLFSKLKNKIASKFDELRSNREEPKEEKQKTSGFFRRMADKVANYTIDLKDKFSEARDKERSPIMQKLIAGKEKLSNMVDRGREATGLKLAAISDKLLNGDSNALAADAIKERLSDAKKTVKKANKEDLDEFAKFYHENKHDEKMQTALERLDDKSKTSKVTAKEYARSAGIATFWSTLKNKEPLPALDADGVVKDIDKLESLKDQLVEIDKLRAEITTQMTEIEDKYGLVTPEQREEKAYQDFLESGAKYARAQYDTGVANNVGDEEWKALRDNLDFTHKAAYGEDAVIPPRYKNDGKSNTGVVNIESNNAPEKDGKTPMNESRQNNAEDGPGKDGKTPMSDSRQSTANDDPSKNHITDETKVTGQLHNYYSTRNNITPLAAAEMYRFAQVYHEADDSAKTTIRGGVEGYGPNFISNEGVSAETYNRIMNDIDSSKNDHRMWHDTKDIYQINHKSIEERTRDVERARNREMDDQTFSEFHDDYANTVRKDDPYVLSDKDFNYAEAEKIQNERETDLYYYNELHGYGNHGLPDHDDYAPPAYEDYTLSEDDLAYYEQYDMQQ